CVRTGIEVVCIIKDGNRREVLLFGEAKPLGLLGSHTLDVLGYLLVQVRSHQLFERVASPTLLERPRIHQPGQDLYISGLLEHLLEVYVQELLRDQKVESSVLDDQSLSELEGLSSDPLQVVA